MLRFNINLSMTLTDVPFLQRFQRAADLGFGAVEFFWPEEDDLDTVAAAIEQAGVEVALINMDVADAAAGGRGSVSWPERREWWQQAMRNAITFAQRIDCPNIHAVAGLRDPNLTAAAQFDCMVENLRWAAPHLQKANVTVLVEALNAYDNPTFLLTRLAEMLDVCARVDSPHMRIQYDVYHMQRMEGNLIHSIRQHLPVIGHVQIADAPDRHEPGTGEIHYPNVLAALDAAGYGGYVGLEYRPRTTVEESLAWLPVAARKTAQATDLQI
ncbi:MAG: TIM barrel protein [Litorilinea sp.]